MGDKTLTVRRANLGTAQLKPEQETQLFETGGGLGGGNGGGVATKVVCLTEVVTTDELKDDEYYEDTLEDMRFFFFPVFRSLWKYLISHMTCLNQRLGYFLLFCNFEPKCKLQL
ncbi:hypothetical protein MKX03_012107 [Papaver bracteatum]|nr:hypothetical protein MKX03_012107 [Papaver bracteatum]